jgi:hypothetical protein
MQVHEVCFNACVVFTWLRGVDCHTCDKLAAGKPFAYACMMTVF